MKKTKNKVGRPKLADKSLKKESIIVVALVLVILVAIIYLSYNILFASYNPNINLATAYNSHVNSCVIENDRIVCGSNVLYMKYKINEDKFINIKKQEENISVKVPPYDNIKFCYKTDNINWRCNN